MITREMLIKGMALGLVRIASNPNDGGTVCWIGTGGVNQNWFYFGGVEADNTLPFEYVTNVNFDEMVEDIITVLNEIKTEFPDEYEFYKLVLEGK